MSLVFGASNTDRVECGSPAILDELATSTYLLWVYITTMTSTRGLYAKNQANRILRIETSAGRLAYRHGRTSAAQYTTNNGALVTNKWAYIAATLNRAGGAQDIFHLYGGDLVTLASEFTYSAFVEGSGTFTSDAAGTSIIGNGSTSLALPGRVGMMAIVGSVLTLDQIIAAQFDIDRLPSLLGLWWPGKNGTTDVPDESGNGNNGTVTGATVGDFLPLKRRGWVGYRGNVTVVAAGAILGAIAGVGDASGVLTGKGTLVAASAGTSTVAGVLSGRTALAASSAGVATVSGTLTAKGTLAGTAAGVATVAALPGGRGDLAGSAAGVANVFGSFAGKGTLVGAIAGTSTVSGTAVDSTPVGLASMVAGVATVSGTLTGRAAAAGLAAGIATVSGTLTAKGALAGAIAGTSTATANLNGRAFLTGSSAGLATVTGALAGRGQLAGLSIGNSTTSGHMRDASATVYGPTRLDSPTLEVSWLEDVTLEVSELGDVVFDTGQL